MKQLLLCAATIAVLSTPGAAMLLLSPPAAPLQPVIYNVSPNPFDNTDLAVASCSERRA